MKEFLEKSILRKDSTIDGYKVKKLSEEIKNEIFKITSFCPDNISLYIRIKCIILQDLKEFPMCSGCNKNYVLVSPRGCELTKTCSKICNRIKSVKTSKVTNNSKYGVNSYTQSLEFKEKTKLTHLKKHGTEIYVCSNDFKEKSKKIKLERYDNETFVNPDKMLSTKLNKYGDKNYNNHEKYIQTCIKKYGVNHVMKVPEIFKKQQNNSYGAGTFHNLVYRGTFEKYFLDLMHSKNMINNLLNGFSVEYVFNNISRIYFPDFILKYKNKKYIIEIKSIWTYDNCGKNNDLKLKNDAKFSAVSKLEGYEFILLMSKEEIKHFVQSLN